MKEYQAKMGDAYVDALDRSGGWSVDTRNRAQRVAMVELVVVELGHGDRKRQEYLDRPEHLPEEDGELQKLLRAPARNERTLRADLLEWAELNRQVQVGNAVAAITPILAYRQAGALLDDVRDPAERSTLLRWQKEVAMYLVTYFGVNPDEAPTTNTEALEVWLTAREAKQNPTPSWVLAKKGPSQVRRDPRVVREDRGDDDNRQGVIAALTDERDYEDGE